MTLEAERGGSTRGAMLDPPTQQDPKLRLEIGICGVTKADGTEVLEVSHLELSHAMQKRLTTQNVDTVLPVCIDSGVACSCLVVLVPCMTLFAFQADLLCL